MDTKRLALAVLLMAAAALVLVPAVSSDSESDVPTHIDQTYYKYGDTATCTYGQTLPEGARIAWSVYDAAGDVEYQVVEGEGDRVTEISVDLSDNSIDDPVYVTQTVTSSTGSTDTQTVALLPLHINSTGYDTVVVTFLDGSTVLSTSSITTSTTVIAGFDHVNMPDNPSKTGYTFAGWYWMDSSGSLHQFSSKSPITTDMVVGGIVSVYAKWDSTGGGGGGGGGDHTIIINNYTVTFEYVNGLRYDIQSSTSSSVVFKVSVIDGYTFDLSTISLTSTAGTITETGSEGEYIYTLSNINQNITVTISADRIYSISYTEVHSTVTVEGYTTKPISTIGGKLIATVTSDDGYTDLTITVHMGGVDVTSTVVSGSTITIDDVTGDLVIVAVSSGQTPTPTPSGGDTGGTNWGEIAIILIPLIIILVLILLFLLWWLSPRVTFDDGERQTKVRVRRGRPVERPEDPVREGMVFEGWTFGGNPYDFEQPVDHSILLKASWREASGGLLEK